jgi:hypothetical protein
MESGGGLVRTTWQIWVPSSSSQTVDSVIRSYLDNLVIECQLLSFWLAWSSRSGEGDGSVMAS